VNDQRGFAAFVCFKNVNAGLLFIFPITFEVGAIEAHGAIELYQEMKDLALLNVDDYHFVLQNLDFLILWSRSIITSLPGGP
jgi:hypothetical protein